MCGIAGILGEYPENRDEQKLLIKKMIAPLQHRGPDGWGIYCSTGIALGHTRLSIIDLSGGNQPFCTDRFALSYNGEIYNYLELREELISHGAVFTSHSDTEVLLKTIEIFGFDGIKKFNGQFAFLLWDKKEKKLMVGRDRYGVRPLYVLNKDGTYYFASEMKSFDQIPGFCREYDHELLLEHGLLWNTLIDQTVWKNIRSVEGGTYELYDLQSGYQKTQRYYSLGESSFSMQPPSTIAEAEERLRFLLEKSVKLRLRSDVPVGVYISGGIDSSVIASITSSLQKERFKTFSITFSDSQYDESSYQKEMIARLGSDHAFVNIDYETVRNNFLNAVYHMERPVFRTAPIPLYLLSQIVNDSDIKVVLTGEASDEILFGYDSFKELKLINFWQKQPKSSIRPLLIKKLYPHLKHYAESKQFGLLKTYYEDFIGGCDDELAASNIRVANNSVIAMALNREYGVRFDKEKILNRLKKMVPEKYSGFSPLQKNQFTEMKTLLSGYLLSSQGDRMSMAHSVEGRYPFLDHELIEEVFSWPDSFKLFGFEQKHVLRRAYRDLIPESIINRPKLPYQAPDVKSFVNHNGLESQARDFLSENMVREYGIFDQKFVGRFVRKWSEGPKEQIGYRDNMLLTFMLSAQMALYWAKNPQEHKLTEKNMVVDITE